MGLDMEIRRISRPNYDYEKVYERCDIDGVILGENDLHKDMYQQLVPYCQKLRVHNQYYNMNKIREDYRLSEHASIGCLSSVGITVYDRRGSGKSVDISANLIDEKYTLDKIEYCFVCLVEGVRYWRKAYDVQDWFHENLEGRVENTGYYRLDAELQDEFNKAWPEHAVDVEEPDKNSALFYWEWY